MKNDMALANKQIMTLLYTLFVNILTANFYMYIAVILESSNWNLHDAFSIIILFILFYSFCTFTNIFFICNIDVSWTWMQIEEAAEYFTVHKLCLTPS